MPFLNTCEQLLMVDENIYQIDSNVQLLQIGVSMTKL